MKKEWKERKINKNADFGNHLCYVSFCLIPSAQTFATQSYFSWTAPLTFTSLSLWSHNGWHTLESALNMFPDKTAALAPEGVCTWHKICFYCHVLFAHSTGDWARGAAPALTGVQRKMQRKAYRVYRTQCALFKKFSDRSLFLLQNRNLSHFQLLFSVWVDVRTQCSNIITRFTPHNSKQPQRYQIYYCDL